MESDSRIYGISDHQIKQVCDTIILFLQALDEYISGTATKRFYLKDRIGEKTRQYRIKCMESEQYLQLSIKPKSNIIEDHLCEQQIIFNGIGDLEESFWEQNHQYESSADIQHGGTCDFSLREKIKAKEEAQFNHPGVQDKVN